MRGFSSPTATALCTRVSLLTPSRNGPTPPAQRIVGRVISVTQAGDIASVLLGFDNAEDLSNGWVDLQTLLRIDGAWKIMNKTATHCSRAAWAAPTVSAEHEAQA